MRPYLICEDFDPEQLANKVNRQIENGYEPIGGVSVSITDRRNNSYCQAMILNRNQPYLKVKAV